MKGVIFFRRNMPAVSSLSGVLPADPEILPNRSAGGKRLSEKFAVTAFSGHQSAKRAAFAGRPDESGHHKRFPDSP